MNDRIGRWRRLADCDALAGAPLGAALNEACDEIEWLRQLAKGNSALHRSAESDVTNVIAELAALDAEMDEYAARHNPACECETIPATREAVRRIRAALDSPTTEETNDG